MAGRVPLVAEGGTDGTCDQAEIREMPETLAKQEIVEMREIAETAMPFVMGGWQK